MWERGGADSNILQRKADSSPPGIDGRLVACLRPARIVGAVNYTQDTPHLHLHPEGGGAPTYPLKLTQNAEVHNPHSRMEQWHA